MIFDIFLDNIIFSITRENTFLGLWIPLILSTFFLIFNIYKTKIIDIKILSFFFVTLFFNYLTTRIITDEITVSLTFSDFSMISLLVYFSIFKEKLKLTTVFYFSFFANLIVDIIAAPNDWSHFLYHIGGAGLFDGLIIHPLVSVITFYTLNKYRKINKKETFIL